MNPPCPHCSSTNVIGDGFRVTKKGRRQRWRCKGCTRKFTLNPLPPGPSPEGERPLTPAEKQARYRQRHGLTGNEWRKKDG